MKGNNHALSYSNDEDSPLVAAEVSPEGTNCDAEIKRSSLYHKMTKFKWKYAVNKLNILRKWDIQDIT